MKTITVRAFTFFMLIAFLAVGSTTDAHHSSPIVPHDSPYDLSFIDMMMMHHRQGLEMARMAESNGQLSELKDFAKRMIADQEKDITELQGYRDRFYASERKADKMRMGDVVMTMAEMQRMSKADMDKLEAASGSQFDHLFVDTMTAHHKMAIRMSQDAQKRAEHTELKEFARMTITKQSGDIKKMARMNGKAKRTRS